MYKLRFPPEIVKIREDNLFENHFLRQVLNNRH